MQEWLRATVSSLNLNGDFVVRKLELNPIFCLSEFNENEEIDVIRLDDSDDVLRFSGASAKALFWISEGATFSEIKEKLKELSFEEVKINEFLKKFEAYLDEVGLLINPEE